MLRERKFQRNKLSWQSKQSQALLTRNSASYGTEPMNSPQSHNDSQIIMIRSNAKKAKHHINIQHRKMMLTWLNTCSHFNSINRTIMKKLLHCLNWMKRAWMKKAKEVRDDELKIQLLRRKLRMIFI